MGGNLSLCGRVPRELFQRLEQPWFGFRVRQGCSGTADDAPAMKRMEMLGSSLGFGAAVVLANGFVAAAAEDIGAKNMTIDPAAKLLTLTIVMPLARQNQDRMVQYNVDATVSKIRNIDGYVGASFYTAPDGTADVEYVQWRNPAVFGAALHNPAFSEHLPDIDKVSHPRVTAFEVVSARTRAGVGPISVRADARDVPIVLMSYYVTTPAKQAGLLANLADAQAALMQQRPQLQAAALHRSVAFPPNLDAAPLVLEYLRIGPVDLGNLDERGGMSDWASHAATLDGINFVERYALRLRTTVT